MKKITDWIKELPKEFRDEIAQTIPVFHMDWAETMREALAKIQRDFPVDSPSKWDQLTRRYMKEQVSSFHVVYWVSKNLTTGKTVDALDFAHAVDLVVFQSSIPESSILYVSAQSTKA